MTNHYDRSDYDPLEDPDWLEIQAALEDAWPSQVWPNDGSRRLLAKLCSPFSKAEVAAGILALALDGERRIPPPGVIAHKVAELSQSGTTWAEVWSEILRQVRTYGAGQYDEIPWATPEIWHFVDHVGYPEFEVLCRCNEGDLAVHEAQWRNKWVAWRDRTRSDRSYGAISGSDLPRLAEARSGRPGGSAALTAGLARGLPPIVRPLPPDSRRGG